MEVAALSSVGPIGRLSYPGAAEFSHCLRPAASDLRLIAGRRCSGWSA